MYTARPILCLRSLERSPPLSRPLRHFSTSLPTPAASPLFNLSAYSNTRENKWFAKATGIPSVEFSPQLQLIRSSEGLDKNVKRPQEQLKQAAQTSSHPAVEIAKKPALADKPRRRKPGVETSVGRLVLDQHESEKRMLLEKIKRLESLSKSQADSIKSLNQLLLKFESPAAKKSPRSSTVDLILILLGVASATSLCIFWGKGESLKSDLLRLTANPWKSDFGSSREVETVIFNTLPGQMHLLGVSGSAKAFLTAPKEVETPVESTVQREIFFEAALQSDAAAEDTVLKEAAIESSKVLANDKVGSASKWSSLPGLFWTRTE